MRITSFGAGLFGLLIVAVAASAVVSSIVEFVAKGKGGKVTYVFSFLTSLVFVFLAFHWDRIGVWTTFDEWIHNMVIAAPLVTSLVVSAFGSWIGKTLVEKLMAKGSNTTTSAGYKDNEEAAVAAIAKEKDEGRLAVAASTSNSYQVRSIANEKLGRLQAAKYEIALHDPDESSCLAALDEVDWDGWDRTLGDIAVNSGKESVARKALGKIQDDAALVDVAARSKNRAIASEALDRIRDNAVLAEAVAKMADGQTATELVGRITSEEVLRRLSNERFIGQNASYETPASVRFEAGRRLGGSEACAAALAGILDAGADGVKAALDSIEDAGFKAEVVKRWLAGAKDASSIAKKLGGTAILEPPFGDDLEGYLCPSGSVHDYEVTTMHFDADSDDYYGIVWCKTCGYRYEVDRVVYMRKEHLFGCEDKKVVCKPGGYVCQSCRAAVQPEGDGPAPCICPECGAENHDWKHYSGEIVHRDYSSGTSYDYCKRCGEKKNIVSHDTW